MPPFKLLYYPSWNPPVKWLRSMLLFFDQIQVIRPAEVENPHYHDANQAVFDLMPDAFEEIRRHHYEMSLIPQNKKMLASLLDDIAKKRKRKNGRRVNFDIESDGSMSIPGYVFLHASKLDSWMVSELERRSLILTSAESILKHANMRDFRIVEQHACNLILALIADHYAKEQGLPTVTDEKLEYIANAFNVPPLEQEGPASMNVASAIIHTQILEKIEMLQPKHYVGLRKRYQDLREPFQHAVTQICDDYHLADINSKEHFDAVVREACRDFCAQTDRLRAKWWTGRMDKWAIMGLGVLSSCSLGVGQIVQLGTGISVGLHVYHSLRNSAQMTDKRTAQQLLGELKGELTHPVILRRITLPHN